MLCEVVGEVVTRCGTFRPGEVIDIPDAVVQKLAGKVRRIDDTPCDLNHMIDAAHHEINEARPDWSGWRASLATERLVRLKALEQEIDRACLAGDRLRLESTLEAYKKFTLSTTRKGREEK